MYSGVKRNKTPGHHLDDQALIFSREEPSREQPWRRREYVLPCFRYPFDRNFDNVKEVFDAANIEVELL